MSLLRPVILNLIRVSVVSCAGLACAQDYPSRPIRIITTPAGGSGDFVSRLIAPGISGPLGQPVVVDNRAETIAFEVVMRAPPDGYTVLVHGVAFWISPLVQKMVYDPVRDFTPVSLLITQPNVLVVHPSLPVRSIKDLIALAKARPGELNYSASQLAGSASQLAAELFKFMAGVNIVEIPYKGAGPAVIAALGGEVQVTFPPAGVATPHIKSGRLRILGVGTAGPSTLFPGVPTIAASGLPGYESENFSVMFAPANTSDAIIKRLNQEVVRVLNMPEVKEKFANNSSEVIGSSPDRLTAVMKTDMARMEKVIKAIGLRTE